MKKIKKEFKNPPAIYRSAPFWSWNEEMTADEIDFQLRDFKAHGIGGAFAHPRIGMTTEYLSEDFFNAFGAALNTAKDADMKIYMYDENAWPSGFAGGKTARIDKEAVSPIAKYRVVDAKNPTFGGEVLFAAEYFDGKLGKVLTEIPKDKWGEVTGAQVIVVYKLFPFSSDWTGGYAYVDISRKETVETFMRLTHHEYAKRFKDDFGTYVPAIFSDEANIHNEGLNTVPIGDHVVAKFRELCGYDIIPNLAAVFRNVEGETLDRPAEKVRYDFFYTLHELWMDNFVKPIAKWCEDNGVAWTGHDIEHHWPQAHGGRINPSEQTTYEYRQWPALDLLLCDWLKTEPSNFDKYLMYEIRSAANQFGHERTLCEAYGAGGYHSTMYDYKRLGDFLMVGGINFICQHLSLFSYLGTRKRDCPQSFDYRQPWWDEYTRLSDYFARTSQILSAGKMEQRILLVNASTTGYLIPPEEADGMVDHAVSSSQVKNPDMSDYLDIVSVLTDNQWDFDIGDEYSIARNTKIEDGLFKFGLQAYDTVVVSKNMLNMRAETAKLLVEFAAAGGRLVTTDGEKVNFAKYIDGETGKSETEAVRSAAVAVSSPAELEALIADTHEWRLKSSVKWPEGVQHIRRALPGGKAAYFIVNHSMGTFETELTLKGDSVAKWDLYTGDTRGLKCTHGDGTVTVPVKLERCGTILLVTGEGLAERYEALPEAEKEVELRDVKIEKDSPNAMTLDMVTWETKGVEHRKRYVLEASDKLFRERGFEHGTPWTHIQVGTKFLDRNAKYGPETAFKVNYTFTVDRGVLPCKVLAGVERPEVWDVLINGTKVTPCGCDPLDHGMGAYDISDYLVEGENTITLDAPKFNVLAEIEAIILRGEFGVKARGSKFILTKPAKKLGYGDWKDYKMPFYQGGVVYTYKAKLFKAPESARLELNGYDATIVSVKVNGVDAGFIGEEGGDFLEIGKLLKRGDNVIEVRVAGSLRNVLGPHHGYNEFIPYDWSMYKRGYVPKADEYAFSPYGLHAKPTLKVK